ncbi:MAG: ribosome maturation factor [Chitinophagaceae bacterium]|nr:ribosome maturation factor [Chitinophagaceae bacterium]
METQVSTIESLLAGLMESQPEYFVVEIKIKPTNNVKVFLDGDQGITIEKCIAFNRALYKQLEETKLFPEDDFSLEVSSPGLDEPLKLHRQYKKNVGRLVEVLLKDGVKIDGKLMEVTEDGIIIEETKSKGMQGRQPGKKKEVLLHSLLLENIKSTKLQVVF